jgi:hypothetical protein
MCNILQLTEVTSREQCATSWSTGTGVTAETECAISFSLLRSRLGNNVLHLAAQGLEPIDRENVLPLSGQGQEALLTAEKYQHKD